MAKYIYRQGIDLEINIKIALKYIIKLYKRSLAIALSIILSVFLVVAIGIIAQSAKLSEINFLKNDIGNYHVIYSDMDEQQLNEIKSIDGIKNISIKSFYDGLNHEDRVLMNINYIDNSYLDMMNTSIINGKFPGNENEIVLEEWVIRQLGIKPELNQEMNIKLENRNEILKVKLVGISKDISSNKKSGMVEGFIGNEDKKNLEDMRVYIEFDEYVNIENKIEEISSKLDIDKENIHKNSMLIEALNQTGKIGNDMITFSIVVSVISYIVIYSIFNISIYKREKEYGVIRAIGGTKTSIFFIIFIELLIISVISIPVGIISGIIGAKNMSSTFGKLFTEFQVSNMNIVVPNEVILLAIGVIILIISVISIVVTKNIIRVSVIDAILSSNRNQVKVIRQLDFKRFYRNIPFDLLFILKSLARYNKRFIAITLSMTIGSIAIILSSYYIDLEKQKVTERMNIGKLHNDYKIVTNGYLNMNSGLTNQEILGISNIDGVEEVIKYRTLYGRGIIEKDILNENYIDYLTYKSEESELGTYIKQYENTSKVMIQSILWGFTDTSLTNLSSKLLEGSIDLEKMKESHAVVVSVPYKNNNKMIDINVGDKIELTFRKDGEMVEGFEDMKDEGEYIIKEFTVEGIIADKDFPTTDDWYSAYGFGIDVVISENIFKDISGFENYRLLNVDKKKTFNDKEVEKEIMKITNKKKGVTVRNLVTQKERMIDYVNTKQTFSYVIISILFMISIFNIINNISYSLLSRVNEFGILRAVGLSDKDFNVLVILEGVIYGGISSILSIILGFVIQYNLYKIDSTYIENPVFNIPINIYILVICINLLIGILSTYIVSRNIKNKSIVEHISSID